MFGFGHDPPSLDFFQTEADFFSDGFPWLFHSLSQIPYGSAAVDITPVLECNRLQNLGALMLSTAVL